MVVGGWQVNAIQRYVSGTSNRGWWWRRDSLVERGNRPNRVLGVAPRTKVSRGSFESARDLYLDVDAFSQPPAFTLGNAPPVLGDVRTFALFNEDFSVLKDFTIHEAHRIQFRAEFFNIFNRVVFGGPAANINAAATFGRIGGQSNSPRNIQLALSTSSNVPRARNGL